MHEKIGEGAYGCVHRPSLRCKDKNIDYENKISKLMMTNLGETEMREYEKISKLDKDNEFFLGIPEMCVPEKTLYSLQAMKKCRTFNISNVDKYSLLILPDGGVNLSEFAKSVAKLTNTKANREYIEEFWIEGHRLLYGIKKMLEEEIVHHDLKAGNIVFNTKTKRLNFIDFGFMQYISSVTKKLKKGTYKFSRPFWYFPFEISLLNRNTFLKLCRASREKKDIYYQRMMQHKIRETELHMKIFYETVDDSKEFMEENMELFYDFFINIKEDEYDNYVNKMLHTIDIYGIGIAYMSVLKNSGHLMNPVIYKELEELFKSMVSASLEIRPNIDEVLKRYELILENTSILTKNNQYFIDNKLQKRDKLMDILYKSLKSRKLNKTLMKNIQNSEPKNITVKKRKSRITRSDIF